MIAIDFMDETESLDQEELDFVQKILEHAAKQEKVTDSEVSVTFVTNEMIRDINREYRGKDQPTDVISFAMEEMGEGETAIIGSQEPRMLGDIIISLDRTKEQAADFGHSFERELGFLAVHGFLHLLGYDHLTEEDEKKMFSRQEEILVSLGITRDKHDGA
ncbi:Metal-dependent hydrolase YbeY, involved in rRNA and/or ribosome maturation and assembly [Planococcus halocryophilus Or1]|uniref:Endoribonuclease YbeY n=1 Tax=Planococcus halocryophilus TaxID=1215089 RepID=A0A1C7DNB4_9BACL|nr:rRNA maturation RNase YbeY [Planococcus halocryophilus]ANU12892.1 rRNA maturation RNase YbeY [Planococcus halocryophilus]EMF45379.1 Metal-dependent hydrolase YbeY, involved in rRNA and/or ribosome maturation and assembly [Planococcus halocryophilus Or1]